MSSKNHTPSSGQLFITRDFKLSRDPTSYLGARNMSNKSIIKRTAVKSPVLTRIEPLDTVDTEEVFGQPPQVPLELSSDSDSNNSDLDQLLSKEDDINEERVEDVEGARWIVQHTRQMEKRKMNNWSMLLVIMMMVDPIPIGCYQQAYQKYKEMKTERTKETMKKVLFRLLSYWGRLFNSTDCPHTFLQDLVQSEEGRKCLSMIVFPVSMRKQLKEWLSQFSQGYDLPIPIKNTEKPPSALPHTTLPSPIRPTTTSTSYMPVHGTSHFVGVQPSDTCQEGKDGRDVPESLKAYKLKTSKTLSSMFFNQGDYRCSLRSPNNSGELLVKMETYRWRDVRSKPMQEWWRHAEVKGFVMTNYSSRLANLAAEMEQEMKNILQSDPSHEGELSYLK